MERIQYLYWNAARPISAMLECIYSRPRASHLVSLPTRLKHKAANDFQTSLEEAAQW